VAHRSFPANKPDRVSHKRRMPGVRKRNARSGRVDALLWLLHVPEANECSAGDGRSLPPISRMFVTSPSIGLMLSS